MDVEKKNSEQENLDRWLDAALRVRADAEPRMGLEDRVLARLATERPQRTFSWMPLLAAAAVLVAISAALIVTYSSRQKPQIANATPPVAPTQHSSQAPRIHVSNTPPEALRTGKSAAGQIAKSKAPKIPRAAEHEEALPRLATFPTPSPETAQERLLAQLAKRPSVLDLSDGASDEAPLKLPSVKEFKIQAMEDTSADDVPQE